MPQDPTTVLPQYIDYGTAASLPVAEQNQAYMLFCEGVGGQGPELIDQTGYFIKYIIDSKGEVSNPSPGNIALINLLDNFEYRKNARIIKVSDTPGNAPSTTAAYTQGVHPVTYIGRLATILISENGPSKINYERTMSFLQSTGTDLVLNMGALYRRTQTLDNPHYITATWNNKVYGSNWGFQGTSTSGNPTNLTSSNDAGTRVKIKISSALGMAHPELLPDDLYWRAWLIVNRPGSLEDLYIMPDWQLVQPATLDAPIAYTAESDYLDLPSGSRIVTNYEFSYYSPEPEIELLGTNDNCNDTYILITQELPTYDPNNPNAGLINGENAIYTSLLSGKQSYFLVDDHPDEKYSILLWNDASQQIFNSGLTQNLNFVSTTGTFAPPTVPFGDTKPGDYIRLEYNKNQVYTIIDVNPNYVSESVSYLAMTVVPNIGSIPGYNTGITAGHLCMYRMINDGSVITLDVEKEPGSFTSILMPEFASDELLNNYEKIIIDLTQKEIIN